MEKILLAADREKCSGCGACAEVCPQKAIQMKPDNLGCLYPEIQEEMCVGCGKCVRICPYLKPELNHPEKAYAAVGTEKEVVRHSASGGVFATIAHSVMAQGGLVAGAVMDCAETKVYHILSGNPEDISKMQGSKYVHSDASRCYREVLKALDAGKTVFFSGTPCQVGAIRQLAGERENLITADIVCHGVPPMQMLQNYLRILDKRLGGKVTAFSFRDKESAKPFTAKIRVQKKSGERILRIRSHYLSFYRYFLEGVIYRENCYSCPYAGIDRCSDLTLGDYWGIEKFHSDDMKKYPEEKYWSCILANTPKGQQFLDRYGKELILLDTQAQWIAQTNQQLNCPSKRHPKRQAVLRQLGTKGYDAVEREYIRENGGRLRFFWRMWKTTQRD